MAVFGVFRVRRLDFSLESWKIDRWQSSGQETKLLYASRPTHGSRFCGFLTNSER